MKNVYILPTDKPSRLYSYKGKLGFAKGFQYGSETVLNQHIYITADEPIKEGVSQWYLDKFLNKPRNSSGSQYGEKQNVIILTTDPDLIKDGIQPISDEFLEWLIKNSSCEFVKVEKCHYEMKSEVNKQTGNYNFKCMNCKEVDYDLWFSSSPTLCFSCGYYNIVIPKEESLLDLDQIIAQKMFDLSDLVITIDKPRNTSSIALEEYPECIIESCSGEIIDVNEQLRNAFIEGAEYQQEKMYSEEEVYKIAKNAFELYRNNNLDDEELEQEFERVIKIWLKKK